MKFSDMTGPAVERLRGEMRSAQVVHAYLFAGPAGTGKRTLAAVCAQALLCAAPSGEKPCGACPACMQFESGNHPDVLYVRPEKSIGVEAVRDLIDALASHPYEGGRHVAVVEQADKMTIQAQNALLKTLETPPGNTVFFLTSNQPSALLPTILSRCRIVRFPLLEEAEEVAALERRGMDGARARLLARLSMGSVGRALEMDASEGYWTLREQVLRSLERLRDPQDVGVAAMPLAEKKEQVSAVLDVMELCARDIMVLQDGDGEVIQTDLADRLPADRFSGADMLSGVMEARKRLASNVSWQSVLEMLFFDMAGGNQLWQR